MSREKVGGARGARGREPESEVGGSGAFKKRREGTRLEVMCVSVTQSVCPIPSGRLLRPKSQWAFLKRQNKLADRSHHCAGALAQAGAVGWGGEGLPVTVSEALYLQTSFSYRNLNLEGIPRL